MKKIVMPEGMLKAAMDSRMETYGHIAGWSEGMCSQVLRAALRWLSENPMVPTDEQMHQLRASSTATIPANLWRDVVVEWQRRMFLAPEQDDPDPEKTRFRAALEKLAKLGNGDSYGNSQGNEIAQEALGVDKRPVPPQEIPIFPDAGFESWWNSLNHQHWVSDAPISIADVKETAYFSWIEASHTNPADLIDRRMREYSNWIMSNLSRAYQGHSPLPHLHWDRSGRLFTYADVVKK